MVSKENAVIVQQVLQAINERDLDAMWRWVAPGFVRHDYGGAFWDGQGPEGLANLVRLLLGVLPDLHLDVREVLATGDRAVAYLTVSGTHRGEFLGVPPTGYSVRFDSVDLYRLEGGQIAEVWPMPDLAGIRRHMSEPAD